MAKHHMARHHQTTTTLKVNMVLLPLRKVMVLLPLHRVMDNINNLPQANMVHLKDSTERRRRRHHKDTMHRRHRRVNGVLLPHNRPSLVHPLTQANIVSSPHRPDSAGHRLNLLSAMAPSKRPTSTFSTMLKPSARR